MKIYNGDGILLGRLCSAVAKELLLGEEVKVVNCDKVVVSGNKKDVFAHYKQKQDRKGYPLKSSKNPRLSNQVVRKAIRGMLPWKAARGREAFENVMCYINLPEELNGKEMIVLKDASI